MVNEQDVSTAVAEEQVPSGEPAEPVEAEAPTLEQVQAELAELKGLRETHAQELERVRQEAKEREAKIQSVKDTEVAEAKRQAEEVTRRRYAFDGLMQLAEQSDQGDVEAAERLQKHLRDPQMAEIWAWGHQATQPEAVQEAVKRAQTGVYSTIQSRLESHDAFKDLGRDKMMDILGKSPDAGEYVLNLAVALAEHMAPALADQLFKEKVGEREKATETRVLEEERRKAGDVAELKGGGGKGRTKAQVEQAYIDGEIDDSQYKSQLEALGSKP